MITGPSDAGAAGGLQPHRTGFDSLAGLHPALPRAYAGMTFTSTWPPTKIMFTTIYYWNGDFDIDFYH